MTTTMKMWKSVALMVFAFVGLTLTSCEEEEAEIRFTEKYCSSKQNVLFEYYSPDPCCIGKRNYVTANGNASELVLKCKDSSYLTISGIGDSRVSTSLYGGWSVTVVDSNCLKFTFDEVEDREEIHEEYSVPVEEISFVNVTIPSGKKESILVYRIYDHTLNLAR